MPPSPASVWLCFAAHVVRLNEHQDFCVTCHTSTHRCSVAHLVCAGSSAAFGRHSFSTWFFVHSAVSCSRETSCESSQRRHSNESRAHPKLVVALGKLVGAYLRCFIFKGNPTKGGNPWGSRCYIGYIQTVPGGSPKCW